MGERQGQTVKDFWLWELDRQGRVRTFIRAESGGFAFDEAASELVLSLNNAHVEVRDQKDPEDFVDAAADDEL